MCELELLRRRRRLAGLVLVGALAGCGGGGTDAVTPPAALPERPTAGPTTGADANTAAYSGPITVRLDKFKEGEVRNGAFDSDRGISDATDHAYEEFVRLARAANGGVDPAAIVVDRITFTLGADTRGVTAFEQIFGGAPVVYLARDPATVNVGTTSAPAGPGPIEVGVTAGRAELAPLRGALLDHNFRIGMRVPAAAARPSAFDARVALTLYFRALRQ